MVALLILAASLAQAQMGSEELLRQADVLLKDKRYDKALELAVAVLEREPENARAQNAVYLVGQGLQRRAKELYATPQERADARVNAARLAAARQKLGRRLALELDQAYERSQKGGDPSTLIAAAGTAGNLLQTNPDLAEFVGARERGRVDEIFENLRRALLQNTFLGPKDIEAAQGYLAYYKGDWEGAVSRWNAALRYDQTDDKLKSLRDRVSAAFEERKKKEAVDELAGQARLYGQSGFWDNAARTWQKLLKLDPANERARQGLAEAKAAAERAALDQRLRQKTERGLALYEQGDFVDSAQVLLEVLMEDPQRAQARDLLKLATRKLKAPRAAPAATAPPAVLPVAAPAPPLPRSEREGLDLYNQGLVAYSEGRLEEARALWERALKADPKNARAANALDRLNKN